MFQCAKCCPHLESVKIFWWELLQSCNFFFVLVYWHCKRSNLIKYIKNIECRKALPPWAFRRNQSSYALQLKGWGNKSKWETCNCQSGLQSAWEKEEEKGVLQPYVATWLRHDQAHGQHWLMLPRGPMAPLTSVKVWVWIPSNSSKLTCSAKLVLNRDMEAALLHSSCTCIRTRTASGFVRSETKLKAACCLPKG